MYSFLLPLHSLMRWMVLASLLTAICSGYIGWKRNKLFTPRDNVIRMVTVTIAHIQLVLGLILYFISPVVSYFLQHFGEAVHMRQIRFFGMEHSLMMVVAVVVITIGAAKAKRKHTDRDKFRTMTLWFFAALLIICSSIPWAFSPLTSRPWFRPFQ